MSPSRVFANRWLPYAAAGALVLVAVAIRLLLDPVVGERGSFTLLILAVALTAGFGGVGPGLLATILAGIAAAALVGLPGSSTVNDGGAGLSLVLFLLDSVVVVFLAGGLRAGRLRAERHAAQAAGLQQVVAGVARELRPQDVADVLLREGLRALGAGTGVVAVLDDDPAFVRVASILGYTPSQIEGYERFPIAAQLPISEAVRLREPIVLPTSGDLARRYPLLDPGRLPPGPSVIVPLLYEDKAVGGMYFRFAADASLAFVDRDYLLAIGRQGGLALERARLREAEHSAVARATFLSEASRLLGASLDVQPTIQHIASLAVPQFADWCAVYRRGPGDTVQMIALEHVDAGLVETVKEFLNRLPIRLSDEHGIGAVIRTGNREFVPEMPPEALAAFIGDDAELKRLVELTGPRSSLTVPLTVGARTIGALSFVMSNSGRKLGQIDLDLATELASRAATAIDNGLLYADLAARVRQQAAVARLGQLALEQQELEPVLEAVARELAGVLDVEFTEVLELNEDDLDLLLVAGVGWGPDVVGRATVDVAQGSQAGYTLIAREPVIVSDLRTEARFSPPALLVDHGVVSGMTVVVGAPRPWGVLGAHTHQEREFTDVDTDFLSAVANVLAGAIERRRRLDSERNAHELGRAFIGVVSHELRTPLTSIYGGTKLLRRSSDAAERAEIIADVEAEADRLYRLTEDLLVMTRLERGDLALTQEPVLLTRLLERVVRSEQRWWPGVEFELTLDVTVPPVSGEDNYVEQVVRNLLSNAGKYSPAGSTVSVHVERSRTDEVLVRVLDRGRGVAAAEVTRLFWLFYRSPATAQQASGAGIGLFVCDQLMKAMGGRIWARPRPDGGSEFGIGLKIYADELADELADEPLELIDTGAVGR